MLLLLPPPVIAERPRFCWKLNPLGEALPPVLGFWYQLLHGNFCDHRDRGDVLGGGTAVVVVDSDSVGEVDCLESNLKPFPFVLWA